MIRRHRPDSDRRAAARRSASLATVLVMGLGATGALSSPAQATGGAFAPPYPTVYISQGDGTNTTLKQALQTRLANASAGGVVISDVGSAPGSLNAVGYRASDNYIYGLNSADGHLVRINADGSATDLGSVSGLTGKFYSGTFGSGANADTYYVTAGSAMRAIDVDTATVTASITRSKSISANDITSMQGYFWGVSVTGGTPNLVRVDPSGTVTTISTVGVLDQTQTGSYGAAWTYGNGNIAFSYNDTGQITQFKVNNATGQAPTLSLVSSISGPSTTSNDATNSTSLPTDTDVTVTRPDPAAAGDTIGWTVTVKNNGPNGTSGAVFTFPAPAGVSSIVLPGGCTQTNGTIQCVVGHLANGESDTFDFTATVPATLPAPVSSTITLTSNEADPSAANNTTTLTVKPGLPALSTSGALGVTQTSAAIDGTDIDLLDGEGARVDFLEFPGQGRYDVVRGAQTTLTFTPESCYVGAAPAVDYTATNEDEVVDVAAYTATVTAPAAPDATPLTSTGRSPDAQSATVTLGACTSLTLLDDGDPSPRSCGPTSAPSRCRAGRSPSPRLPVMSVRRPPRPIVWSARSPRTTRPTPPPWGRPHRR